MAYACDPYAFVGVGADDHAALTRIARAIGDDEALSWLGGMKPDEKWPGDFKTRFGELTDRLIGFIVDWGVGDYIRVGAVSREDAGILAGTLTHCLQYHVKPAEIVDGSVMRRVEDVWERGRFRHARECTPDGDGEAYAIALAREAVRDYYPDAFEEIAVMDGMSLLDAIESPDGSTVRIMYDDTTGAFALDVQRRSEGDFAEGVERESRRESLLNEIELKIAMLFGTCDEAEDAGACWAAVAATAAQSARLRIREVGGDPDEVVASIDRYFLMHPEH